MSAELTTAQLDRFFKSFLAIDDFSDIDNSMNGLQTDNDGAPVRKIAFGVDASLETFKRAVDAGAGMLFVHHGLFWGKPLALTGNHRQRIKFLLDHNLSLYAVHLPLDQHPTMGNNAGLAGLLELKNIEPFGPYHGKKIGYKGTFARPLAIEDAAKKIGFMNRPPLGVFPFGKAENNTCAIVSGGAAREALRAIEENIDLFVTGEAGHEVYHECLEGKMNMVCGGHYNTEVWGVRAVMRHCTEELHIDTEFVDVPTGL